MRKIENLIGGSLFLVTLVVAAVALDQPLAAQSILGHEYELEAAPIREGEEPVIPLDQDDPSYDIWRQLRDLSEDPDREPGIINLQKYNFGFSSPLSGEPPAGSRRSVPKATACS